jgi:PAS domain S-box-containing protein
MSTETAKSGQVEASYAQAHATQSALAEDAQSKQMHVAAMRLAAIVESSDDAIASKDLNGVVTSWNAAAERIFGWKAEEIIGKPITILIPPELHKDEEMILSRIRRGERIEHFETVRLRKDGERVQVSLTISPIKDDDGQVIGASKIARDISERKRAEEALQRAEKLAATGQVAASIAHEINNPMQALTNILALISYKTARDHDAHQLVLLAEAELNRMSHIARQMLSFYHETTQPVPLKIDEAIEDVLEPMATRLRARHIQLSRQYEFSRPVRAFPVEMRQLFANLISNAAEAAGEGGTITLRVHGGHDWRTGRTGVRVLVADNGGGIRPEVRSRVFEPFFTTKADKGTGLGLWVVNGIISRHHGSIHLRSSVQPGRSGTVFSIFIPDADSEQEPARAA